MKTRIRLLVSCAGLAAALLAAPTSAGSSVRLFVRADAPAGGDGLSWSSAYNDLQDAIEDAESNPSVGEIWVAQGLYLPSRREGLETPRSETFKIPNNVAVYGGFRGDENTLAVPPITERRYETILSGDLGQNDGQTIFTDNATNVVRFAQSGALDGLTIERGRADGGGTVGSSGGGGARDSTITSGAIDLKNCVFRFNSAINGGGVFVLQSSSLRVHACVFENNSSVDGGGGLYSGADFLVITSSAFLRNTASGLNGEGGGLLAGGIFNTVTNCTFVKNHAGLGAGGIEVAGPGLSARNSIFWGNTGGHSTVELNQFNGHFASAAFSIIQGLGTFYGGMPANTAADPLLLPIARGPDTLWNTSDDVLGYVPGVGSPALNSGDNNADIDNSNKDFDPLPATEVRGGARIAHCNDPDPPAQVDRGAAEVQPGEPAYWIQLEGGSWSSPSNWLDGTIGDNCHGAVFGGLDPFTTSSFVNIPGKYLATPAFLDVRDAEIFMTVGELAFLDASGSFAGIEGFVRVDGGSLQLAPSGKFQPFGQTRRLVVGDELRGLMSLTSFTLEVDGPADVGGDSSIVGLLDGASLQVAGDLTLAPYTTDSALVEVDGDSQLGVSGALIVGEAGFGEFGTLGSTSAADLRIGGMSGGAGLFRADPGSTTSVSGNVEIGLAGLGGSELLIHSPFFFGAQVVAVGPGSSITGDGAIDGAVDNRGVVSPGLSGDAYAGDELLVNGWYLQQRLPGQDATDSGSLVIDIDSGEAMFSDRLIVSGMATLGGGLFLRGVDGFDPAVNGTGVSPLSALSISGQFDVVFTPFFPDGRFLRVRYENIVRERGFGGFVTVYVDVLNSSLEFDEGDAVTIEPGASASAAATDFFDADPFVDLAVTLPSDDAEELGCVLVLANEGNDGEVWQGYTVAQCVTVGRDPSAVATGDFNGDSRPDLAVANRADNTVSVLINDGEGDFSFLPPITLVVGKAPVDIGAADLDLDGFVDIVTANEIGGGASVLFGQGLASFAPAIDIPTGESPSSLSINDFSDAPGLEIAVANRGSGTITIIADDGQRALGGVADIDLGDGGVPDDVDSGIVDNDKDVDIVGANPTPPPPPGSGGPTTNTGSVVVVRRDRNSPTGFSAPVNVPAGSEPTSVALTDTDGDGDRDIAVVTSDDTRSGEFIRLIRNDLVPADGQLVFTPWQDVQTGDDPTFVLPADVNGDGLDDLVTLNTISNALRGVSTSQVTVLLNAYQGPLPGDVDGDGLVNMTDLNLVLQNFNTFGIGLPGDLDNDDFVGFGDLNTVLSNFNN